ncbi:MAG: thioredoxin [Lachnospiraceae bacterium]|nr:thioredoxin [Lachnospiraceae bacterium]
MQIISKNEFEEKVLKSDKKVVVDFFATWCGPCKMLSPILEEVSKEYEGKVDFYKVDINKDMEIAQSFGIMSVPTVYVFEKGKVVNKSIGLADADTIKGLL